MGAHAGSGAQRLQVSLLADRLSRIGLPARRRSEMPDALDLVVRIEKASDQDFSPLVSGLPESTIVEVETSRGDVGGLHARPC